jgi:superfamily II DNA/RNA helicase
MNKYVEMREEILKKVKENLVGPGTTCFEVENKEEIIIESPMKRYSMGILYPQGKKQDTDIEDTFETSDNQVSSSSEDDEAYDIGINSSNEFYPSSVGMSFSVSGYIPPLILNIKAAKYKKEINFKELKIKIKEISEEVKNSKIFNKYLNYNNSYLTLKKAIDREEKNKLIKLGNDSEFKDAINKLFSGLIKGWKRIPIKETIKFNGISDDEEISKKYISLKSNKDANLKIGVLVHPDKDNDSTIYTISLINNNIINETENQRDAKESYYQVNLIVELGKCKEKIIEYNKLNTNNDKEEKSMDMLYRNKKNFGIGHGCAVTWDVNKEHPEVLKTSIIPTYEVPQMKYHISELKGKAKKILKIKNLSSISSLNKNEKINWLNRFTESYNKWIKEQKKKIKNLPREYWGIAQEHIDKCFQALERMNKGIKILEKNDKVYKSFCLANKEMLMQMEHSKLQKNKRYPDGKPINWPDYSDSQVAWRPFQLAFILLNIEGLVNPESKDRDIVDLIWFPTGGGKTEAYLGIAAFTIFLRRIENPEKYSGTAILMRYTLRLLTTQQFQRASTLILACEVIRKNNLSLLGKDEISIGLWIGGSSTPNYINDAFDKLKKIHADENAENPFQVLNCPWCGTKLTKNKGKGEWGYLEGSRPKRLIIYCPEKTCEFHQKLPIKVVDEDIYRKPPTLLFGTVDKFALLPWKKEVSNLFSLNNENLPPELIIQDELHLISGPLGTIVGLYESVIDLLSSNNERSPKIISSTATIKRASEQVKSLYNREVKQFPSPGINIEDSYFSREASFSEKPGRLYAGVMSSGRTSTTTLIRSTASILQTIKELEFDDEIKDKYWTLVGYFNSIRELGKTATLANDDIKSQVRKIAYRNNSDQRLYYEPNELTSRKKADEIPEILEKMEESYPSDSVINILLASNMISVGVDVDRLSLMTVVGQPKTTSEYIQATSRIGRKYPGIIFTNYNGTRPRDRSHYESFISYHNSLYRFVEPTSVTPFSVPARDKALKGIIISLMRHYVGWRKDNELKKFDPNNYKYKEAKEYLIKRVEDIEPREIESLKNDFNKLEKQLKNLIEDIDEIVYSNPKKHSLLYRAGSVGEYWKTLTSMRNVDSESNAKIIGYRKERNNNV